MQVAVSNVARLLRPGTGRVLFRDYARGDLAQDKHEVRWAGTQDAFPSRDVLPQSE
jgi:hypothetical protein